MDFKISKILAKDLLQRESQYVKDRQLIFNRIVIESLHAGHGAVNFYYDNNFLASTKLDCSPGPYTKFDFQLSKGNMKLYFEDKDVYSPPESTILEKAKKAVAKAMEDLEAL